MPLASGDIPNPLPWIVDAQMALFREQLAKILEKFCVKIWVRWCVCAGILVFFYREDAKDAKDFLF